MKITEKEWKELFFKAHGGKYGYHKSDFSKGNARTKIQIFCRKHGFFWMTRSNHARGSVCSGCQKFKSRITKNEWLIRFEKKHADKYSYHRSVFEDSMTEIKIFCKKCCEFFEKTPHTHAQGTGCPQCQTKKTQNNITVITPETWRERLTAIHGNKFDYSKTKFKKVSDRITIYCNQCKQYFTQYLVNHYYKKCGCNLCRKTPNN